MKRLLLLIVGFVLFLAACAPTATTGASVTPPNTDVNFELQPIPQEQRWIIAVPNFEVGTSGVKIGEADLSKEGDEFFKELARARPGYFWTH
jgi:ABC-type glycerol-3-phosphate transport system substrate-binding protein